LATIPPYVLQPFFFFLSYCSKNLNCNLSCFNLEKGGLGNAIILNFGKEGYESIAIPLTMNMQVSVIVTMGKLTKIPRIEDGKVVSKNCIEINLYVDHRYTDGSKGATMYKIVS